MITKGLTQFVYIQGLMYCLSNESCSRDCEFYSDDEFVTNGCGVFDGKFAYMDRSIMLSMQTALKQHDLHSPYCESCVFKHKNTHIDDCYYTDFVVKIGFSVWPQRLC